MGLLFFFVSWWGFILQAVAIIHFIRRRPDWYWLLIILIGGWLGALAYILVEMIPDASLLSTSFQIFPRRRRIRELERAILDNPSAGNYEELGLLYLDDGDFSRARAAYDKSISARTDSPDPFYRRGIAEVALGDFPAAIPTSSAPSPPTPATIFIALRACSLTPTRKPAIPIKPKSSFSKPPKFPRTPKPITTTRYSFNRKVAPPKPATGRRKSSTSVPPCPATSVAVNVPWFRKAQLLLARLRVQRS